MEPGRFIKTTVGICILSLFLAGCQGVTPIEVKAFKLPEQKAHGELLIGDLAKNVRKEPPNLIGYHTATVAGVKTTPIQPASPPGMQNAMTEHIKNALRAAGYQLMVVPPGTKPEGPVLRGEIRKFWFSSYWWFWPITIVSGEIKLQLILESPEREILWEKECKGSSGTVAPSVANVDSRIKDATTQVCNKVIEAVTSDEFRQALSGATRSQK